MDSVVKTVQNYLDKNMPELSNSEIHLDTQDGARDEHFAKSPLLPDVSTEHVDDNQYHVATVTNNVEVEGGAVIPKVFKFVVKGGNVDRVMESK